MKVFYFNFELKLVKKKITLKLNLDLLRRIVHRDIKTANIFLNKNKELKIGDFGISKSLDQSVMAATAMIGTPYYLSPEMV